MSKETDKIIAGFMRLNSSDQSIIIKEINEYLKKDYPDRRALKESFEKRAGIDLGPLNQGGCPCCGK
jgi:hypothetical protein